MMSVTMALAATAFFAGCASHPEITNFDQQAFNKDRAASLELHDGDSVRIDFPGAAKFSGTQTIRRDGKITMPSVGEIQAAGLTPHELEKDLLKDYDTLVVDKEVTVSVVSSIFMIYVTGAVGHSGKLTSDRPLTPLEALLEAGVDVQNADLKHVTVIRTSENGDTQRFKLNVNKVLKHGERPDPFALKPLDIIYVPQKFQWL
ncbi:MAG TPA: polysaccharide biosynthesis/export family protein [Verrucomicrobiae bacterium]|jgi:polysaccharide export outer membrane protein|nr:polysaccharide biosynthesis/export family protein [Verrucomicrobiae bacterium]